VVMNAGRIEQIGRPLDVYDRPASLYVAQFIGSPVINVWRGTAEAGAGGVAVRLPGGTVLPLGPAAPTPAPSTALAAAFRPEHVELADDGPLEARVEVVETLGPETYVYVDIGGERTCVRVDRSRRMAPGDRVRLRVPPAAIHLFDATSGERLGAGHSMI